MQLYKSYKPIVSIVLPTYNRGKLIERPIDSVLKQTFENWELIIVDDGSDDDTYSLVNRYLMKNEKIRYLKQTNRKPPLAFNTGIQASIGEYVTFIGSDDEYKSNHLETRLNYFKEDKSLDFVHGGLEVIGRPFVKDKNDLSREIAISDCVAGGTFFGKRELFLSLGGFQDIKYSDDSDFYERLLKTDYKIKKVDDPTYIYYRDTEDSICNTIT
ncbi:MAG: glycosyltransferase family 2 protein [Melioribacteraceae bacterium]|nr:glycosyltransferase family 2 protein [Melioribacteraceae bacterium]